MSKILLIQGIILLILIDVIMPASGLLAPDMFFYPDLTNRLDLGSLALSTTPFVPSGMNSGMNHVLDTNNTAYTPVISDSDLSGTPMTTPVLVPHTEPTGWVSLASPAPPDVPDTTVNTPMSTSMPASTVDKQTEMALFRQYMSEHGWGPVVNTSPLSPVY